jgi:hypothetical protein
VDNVDLLRGIREEGDRWSNPDQGATVNGWYHADGVEAAEQGVCSDSGVLIPATIIAAFLKRFKSEFGSEFLRDAGNSKQPWLRILPS